MKKLISLVSIVILSTNLILAQIVNVPADYSTIQEGVDAAVDGDTVLVAPGTYYENLTIEKSIVLTSQYLYSNDTSYINSTIIDGSSNLAHVVFVSTNNSNDTLIIQGFTIQNGAATINEFPDNAGGGIYCDSTNLILSNLRIRDNFAEFAGGGLYGLSSNILIDSVIINNNNCNLNGGGSALIKTNLRAFNSLFISNKCQGAGGGLYLNDRYDQNTSAIINNCKIVLNRAEDDGGGGIYSTSTNSLIVSNSSFYDNFTYYKGGGIYASSGGGSQYISLNNTFKDNMTRGYGGAAYISFAKTKIINTLFHHNTADYVGGLYLEKGWNPQEITNCTFFDNHTLGNDYTAGGAILDYGRVNITNCIFWNNDNYELEIRTCATCQDTIRIINSNLMGGMERIKNIYGIIKWGGSNIDEDPLFLNTGDYPIQLSHLSPCIDAGFADTIGLPEFDLAGEIRVFNDRVDMGAYEWNTLVGMDELINETSNWNIITYPNPFTTTTNFEYTLQQPSTVHITIFNHLGEQVAEIQQQQSSVKQQVTWDAVGLPSGVYFYRFQAGEQFASGKIILNR